VITPISRDALSKQVTSHNTGLGVGEPDSGVSRQNCILDGGIEVSGMSKPRVAGCLQASRRLISKASSPHLWLVWMAAVLFSAHYLLFRHYITDDAGITFASAKTLAEYGRFSIDRFAERVEAYSNPLWMMLLAGANYVGVRIPTAAKIMSYGFGLMAVLGVYWTNREHGKQPRQSRRWMNAAGALMLAGMTAFVVWGAAGLENGLYAFLVVGLIYECLRFDKSASLVPITACAFLVSITRPEGILLVAFAYLGLFMARVTEKRGGYRQLVLSGFLVATLYIMFLIGRYHVFAWTVPNTYYAKVTFDEFNIARGIDYTLDFTIHYWPVFLLEIILLYMAVRPDFSTRSILRKIRSNKVIWYSIFLILANTLYVVYVGGAFFGIGRFFTPTLACLALICTELLKEAKFPKLAKMHRRPLDFAMYASIALLVVSFVLQMGSNTASEYSKPWVPFSSVKATHADLGNMVGGYLISNNYLPNAKHVPYMVPDIGATAYYADNYTVIDYAMLGNVPFAHNRYERAFFQEYVFNTVKPVLICASVSWSFQSSLLSYSDFTDGYELIAGPGTSDFGGAIIAQGYFVRSDIFVGGSSPPVDSSDRRLILKGSNVNCSVFASGGEMLLCTNWQKSASPIAAELIDQHVLHICLENVENHFVIDEHQIAGGYYLPSRWDVSDEIVDKRVICVRNVPDGDYRLVARVSYPDGTVDTNELGSIKIVSEPGDALGSLVNDFMVSLADRDYLNAEIALGKIRAVDLEVYRTYIKTYTRSKLDFVNSLIEDGQPFEAFEALYPLDGSQLSDDNLDRYLGQTEAQLSRLLQQEGQRLESAGEVLDAIRVYEKSMWLDPDNSHLRTHIEQIRQGVQ